MVDDSQVLALGFRVNTSTTTNANDTSFAGPQWYILKVAFNREDSIREALEKRIKLSNFQEYFGEILVPTEDVVEFTRAGKRRVVKRKLYPGYLMIQMIINDDTWFLVRETPGIGDFTGTYGKPTPMTDADVERIIKLVHPDVDQEHAPKTSIPFRPGDRVRVKEGNFQSLEGDVDRIDEANGRVTVIINIFGRSTPVELDHWQIESL
jgi:transcriptional antiterminator NusG